MKKLILLTGMLLMMTAKSVFASPVAPKIPPSELMAASEITETFNQPVTSTAVPKLEPIERMSTSQIRETISEPTTYIFEGVKGRELTLSLWAGQLTAELYSPNGQNMGVIEKTDNQWIGQLPESGIYRVRVTPKGETSSFVLGRDFNAKWTYRPLRNSHSIQGKRSHTQTQNVRLPNPAHHGSRQAGTDYQGNC